MDKDSDLCPTGLTSKSVAKLDIAKLRKPKEWGWRFLAFDFIMPNHQIVECYIVFQQMEAAKKLEDPEAEACPDLSNHEIFEKWRIEDTSKLKGDKLEEFNSDKLESNRRYDAAFGDVVRHTSKAEIAAFFEPFGVTGNIAFFASGDVKDEQGALHARKLSSTKSGVGFTNPLFKSGFDAEGTIRTIRDLKATKSGLDLSSYPTHNNNIRNQQTQEEEQEQEQEEEGGASGEVNMVPWDEDEHTFQPGGMMKATL
jgi:hypothetical protein